MRTKPLRRKLLLAAGVALATSLAAAAVGLDRIDIALDHAGFALRTPEVARDEALEARYGELLERVREHLRRAPAAGFEATAEALRADALVKAWCERPEVLGLVVRARSGAERHDLVLDGFPDVFTGTSWMELPGSPLTHGRKWRGFMEYEFARYAPALHEGGWELRIELMLDMLQLRGLQGLAYPRYGGTTRDPVP